MDERYQRLSNVPENALKKIDFGKLKGKSDINPQWRYEALTEVFGLCGFGWKYEITDTKTVPVPATGETLVFVFVNLFVKEANGGWSDPIPGSGGDFLIVKDKNGIHGNDEAFKMATTDALGTAAKMVGVAATVYRGLYGTKYARQEKNYSSRQQSTTVQHPTQAQANELEVLCQKCGKKIQAMLGYYHVNSITDLDMKTFLGIKRTLEYHLTKEAAISRDQNQLEYEVKVEAHDGGGE